jgi:hypothetical protein
VEPHDPAGPSSPGSLGAGDRVARGRVHLVVAAGVVAVDEVVDDDREDFLD